MGVYLPLYDLMAERWAPAWWAPLAAGSAARTVAVLSTSPLELVRTRMQACSHAQPAAHDVEFVWIMFLCYQACHTRYGS